MKKASQLFLLIWCSLILPLIAEPSLRWQLATTRAPLAILEDHRNPSYLYLAEKENGVTVIKKEGSKARVVARISKRELGGLDATNLAQKDDVLYVSIGNFFQRTSAAGLATIDLKNPSDPKLIARVIHPNKKMHGTHAVILGSRYAYVCAMEHGILIYDIQLRGKPKFVTSIVPDLSFPKKKFNSVSRPNARHACLQGDILWVAYDAGGVRAIDVSDPKKPKEVGKYINKKMGKKQQAYNEIVVRKGIAYVSVDYAGLETLDVRNPKKIKPLSWWNPWNANTPKNIWFNSPGHGHQLVYNAKKRQLLMSAGDSELIVFDLSNPKKPVSKTSYGKPKNGRAMWSVSQGKDGTIYLGYIKAAFPFKGTWAGIKAVK